MRSFKRTKAAAEKRLVRIKKRKAQAKLSDHNRVLLVNCTIGDVPVRVMIDNGCDVSGVSREFIRKNKTLLNESILPLDNGKEPLASVTGGQFFTSDRLVDKLQMGDYTEELDLKIVPIADVYDILLGNDWLALNKVNVNHDPEATERVTIVVNNDGNAYIKVLASMACLCPAEERTYAPQVLQFALSRARPVLHARDSLIPTVRDHPDTREARYSHYDYTHTLDGMLPAHTLNVPNDSGVLARAVSAIHTHTSSSTIKVLRSILIILSISFLVILGRFTSEILDTHYFWAIFIGLNVCIFTAFVLTKFVISVLRVRLEVSIHARHTPKIVHTVPYTDSRIQLCQL